MQYTILYNNINMFSNIFMYFKKGTSAIVKHNKKSINKVFNTNKSTKSTKSTKSNKYKKKKIPKALREQVWINKMGKTFSGICSISWCENDMSCFNFDCGHNIPESKGGPTNIENLIPICRNCNVGMGNKFTIEEWEKKYEVPPKWYNIKYWM